MQFQGYSPPQLSRQYIEKRKMLWQVSGLGGIRVVDQMPIKFSDLSSDTDTGYLGRAVIGAVIGKLAFDRPVAGAVAGLLFGKTVLKVVGFGDTTPQMTTDDIILAQRTLKSIGFDVDVNGKYDAKTSASVLEFRGAAGLPALNQIDDDFMARLYDELDRVGTDLLPSDAGGDGGMVDDINISGKYAAAGLGLLALLGVAWYLKNRK